MAMIGIFTRTADGTLSGNLRTLTLNTTLQFVPETHKSKDSAPDFRILLGRAEAGVAWKRIGRDSGREYWSVKLDDPTFSAPLFASLVNTEDDQTFNLLWSRRNGD
jgi:uncharacterized protein (DUF736 family)